VLVIARRSACRTCATGRWTSRPRPTSSTPSSTTRKASSAATCKLWKWLGDARGGHGTDHKLSNRQYENLLRENFINIRRVREWRDIHSQLHTVVGEHKWVLNDKPASYEQLHLSMLAACSATSAARATRKTGTWARAASSSTATPART
jgi:hypothetical protein